MTKKTEVTKKTEDKSPVKTAPPANPLDNLRGEIEQVFDNFMRGWPEMGRMMAFDPFRNLREPLDPGGMAFSPSVDVSESDSGYEISAELPGIQDKDIELTLRDNVLTLKAEKKSEREQKDKDYHLSERSYGLYQRSFRLPDDADPEQINTRFANGVLVVTLPKSARTPPNTRKIEVKTG